MVYSMYNFRENYRSEISAFQLKQFQALMTKLYQCCQDRIKYQCDRFNLPDAELRCLLLFGEERYLTATGIVQKMNVVKSRVTKIIDGLVSKNLVHRVQDPEDSRIILLSLTLKGQQKLNEVIEFLEYVHHEALLQMEPEQRKTMLTNLDILKASLESVKELMV
jgi:DNA-binding MarR family transcriptional regulator